MYFPSKKYKDRDKNKPVFKSYYKFKKNNFYDFNIDKSIIESPTNSYWNTLADKMKSDVRSCYTDFIRKYFKRIPFSWTTENDSKLIDLINFKESWLSIGFRLNINPIECIKRCYQLENTKAFWTPDEDKELLRLVSEFSNRWVHISTFFSNKSRTQCLQRYKKLTEGVKKGRWSDEEDRLLISAINKYKDKGWKYISQYIPNRSDSQCRERWTSALDPILKKGKWTKEEDKKLIDLIGKSWEEISDGIKGRNINQCKRRYKTIMKSEET